MVSLPVKEAIASLEGAENARIISIAFFCLTGASKPYSFLTQHADALSFVTVYEVDTRPTPRNSVLTLACNKVVDNS